jgi:hypothetical protein
MPTVRGISHLRRTGLVGSATISGVGFRDGEGGENPIGLGALSEGGRREARRSGLWDIGFGRDGLAEQRVGGCRGFRWSKEIWF